MNKKYVVNQSQFNIGSFEITFDDESWKLCPTEIPFTKLSK